MTGCLVSKSVLVRSVLFFKKNSKNNLHLKVVVHHEEHSDGSVEEIVNVPECPLDRFPEYELAACPRIFMKFEAV